MNRKYAIVLTLLMSLPSLAGGEPQLQDAKYLFNKAEKHVKNKQYSHAIRSYEKGINIYKKILGDDHTEVARSTILLALIYKRSKNYNKSRALLNQALNFYRGRRLQHDFVLGIYRELGYVSIAERKNLQAISEFKKGLAIASKYEYSKARDRLIFGLQDGIGDAYYYNRNYKEAIRHFQINFSRKSFKSSALVHSHIAKSYYRIGNYPAALTHFQMRITRLQRHPRKNRIKTAYVYHAIGNTYKKLKNHQKAIEYLLLALKIYKTKLRPNNFHFYEINKQLAEEYRSIGKNIKSVKFYKKLLYMERKRSNANSEKIKKISSILQSLK